MKILEKKSSKYEDWIMEVECNGKGWNNKNLSCNSTLEIDKNDLLCRSYYTYPFGTRVAYGIICPVCNCFTEIQIDNELKKIAKAYQKVE